jgi:hypothetical protein
MPLYLKRLSVAAILGSLVLFYNLKPKRTYEEITIAIDEEDKAVEDPGRTHAPR